MSLLPQTPDELKYMKLNDMHAEAAHRRLVKQAKMGQEAKPNLLFKLRRQVNALIAKLREQHQVQDETYVPSKLATEETFSL